MFSDMIGISEIFIVRTTRRRIEPKEMTASTVSRGLKEE